jgi:AcrR family transcriptional regulator
MEAGTNKEKRTKSSAARTKRKIVDATLAIAAEKGFDAATTAEIAQRAGVSEGSIYNHFRTKDDLLIHMVGEFAGSFLSNLLDALSSESDAESKLRRLIAFHIGFFTQEGNIFQVIYGKRPGAKVQMARIIQVAIGPYVGLIAGIVREGIDAGVFRPATPELVASVLLGGMQLTLLRRFFEPVEFSMDEAVEEITRIFFDGVLAAR